ncbi:MAG: hypothetical protein R3E01_00105 [Pirellulaceae bacterium]|nr:hypothetical protein [Planctomycetales bacterium]
MTIPPSCCPVCGSILTSDERGELCPRCSRETAYFRPDEDSISTSTFHLKTAPLADGGIAGSQVEATLQKGKVLGDYDL